jgi:flagellar hook assembly protein FlgD
MSRVFPNPTRGNTVVRFEINQPQPVRIAVFDAAGRRLRSLADGPFSLGQHERIWDATNDAGHRVAPGVYFVRAEASTGRASERVLVLK